MIAVLLGLFFGLFNALVDIRSSLGHYPAHILQLMLGAGWAWASLGVLSGWLAIRTGPAMASGVGTLMAGTIAYYAYGYSIGEQPLSPLDSREWVWLLAALGCGPFLGLIGAWMRRPGLGVLAGLVIPVVIVVEVFAIDGLASADFTDRPTYAWTHVAMLVIAAVLAGRAFVRRGTNPNG